MSEKIPSSPEQKESSSSSPEQRRSPEISHEHLQTKEMTAEDVRHMSEKASEKAKDSSEVLNTIHSESTVKKEDSTPSWTNARLRNHNFDNIMRSTRRKLGSFDKRYSKLIHSPAVDKISEASSKTVARPSAFLGGALASLIGSSIVLYFARRNGFEVKPVIFVLLFLGGYIIALALDLLLGTSKKIFKK